MQVVSNQRPSLEPLPDSSEAERKALQLFTDLPQLAMLVRSCWQVCDGASCIGLGMGGFRCKREHVEEDSKTV